MAPVQSLSVTFARRGLIDFARRDAAHTVVWLRGEHDISTVGALSETLARAIARDADVVVDLSEVDFMGAATVGVIIRAGSSSDCDRGRWQCGRPPGARGASSTCVAAPVSSIPVPSTPDT